METSSYSKYEVSLNEFGSDLLEKIVFSQNVNSIDNEVTAEDVIKAALNDYFLMFTAGVEYRPLFLINTEKSNGYILNNNFKKIMKEKNLRNTDLERVTDIKKSNLSDILNNKHQPSLENFFKLWEALGCPALNTCLCLKNN